MAIDVTDDVSPRGLQVTPLPTHLESRVVVSGSLESLKDPAALTVGDLALPPAWPDFVFRRLGALVRFLSTLLFGGRAVELPHGLPGGDALPPYLLREFHRMPNGYYSHLLARGYERGFERSMLGQVARVRRWIAEEVKDCRAVLDIGCGSGKVAGAVRAAGVPDVWGIDASLYQLHIAARAFPGLALVQGLAEQTPFESGRFDGVTACFLFHELPTHAQDAVLAEMRRVLAPGGRLVMSEPSPEQLSGMSYLDLWRLQGWRGVYFRLLARLVTEPYVAEWHARDVASWAPEHGFEVVRDDVKIPFRRIVLRRV